MGRTSDLPYFWELWKFGRRITFAPSGTPGSSASPEVLEGQRGMVELLSFWELWKFGPGGRLHTVELMVVTRTHNCFFRRKSRRAAVNSKKISPPSPRCPWIKIKKGRSRHKAFLYHTQNSNTQFRQKKTRFKFSPTTKMGVREDLFFFCCFSVWKEENEEKNTPNTLMTNLVNEILRIRRNPFSDAIRCTRKWEKKKS